VLDPLGGTGQLGINRGYADRGPNLA